MREIIHDRVTELAVLLKKYKEENNDDKVNEVRIRIMECYHLLKKIK